MLKKYYRFITRCKTHNKVTYKTAKKVFITSRATNIVRRLYSTAVDVMKLFLPFYMCQFTIIHCYKSALCYIYL